MDWLPLDDAFADGRPVLVFVHAFYDHASHVLDAEIFEDLKLPSYACARADVDRHPEIAARLEPGLPRILIVSPEKKLLADHLRPTRNSFSHLLDNPAREVHPAPTTLADWEKLTGAQTADELALKANAYYRVDQFQPAVDAMKKALSMTDKPNDSWTQILMASYFELNQFDQAAELIKGQLAKDPNNKKLINQLATVYIQGDKDQMALDLMAKAKSQGLVTTNDDYVQLAKLYAQADKPKDAAATIKEGFAKGALQGTYDNYKLQGDVCTQAEDDPCAIEGYTKAAPMSKDGNVDYQLGYLLFYSGKSKEAVDSLNKAISRGGLRQEGEAYLLRGDAQNDLGQGAAANADWQKAAGYASTKTMAEQRLKAAKSGVKINRATKKK